MHTIHQECIRIFQINIRNFTSLRLEVSDTIALTIRSISECRLSMTIANAGFDKFGFIVSLVIDEKFEFKIQLRMVDIDIYW